jgi:TolB protein
MTVVYKPNWRGQQRPSRRSNNLKLSDLLAFGFLVIASATSLLADEDVTPAAKPMIGRLPAPSIGWTGNWGMAASGEDKDYVHLVTDSVAAASGSKPLIMVKNIADFERGYTTYDPATGLKEELDFHANIVIVAIGENVAEPTTDESKSAYAKAFSALLTILKKHGEPTIFVRSSFWANVTKDSIMQQAAMDAHVTFVDVKMLGNDESNMARSERQIEHAGVGGHPGDKGMKAIADAIFASIQREAGVVAQRPQLIGYTAMRTDLPGGRHANIRTMRAHVMNADGTNAHEIAAELIIEPDAWTQFAGWSPDGKMAIVARGWQSPENAAIEEDRKEFHFTQDGWLLDAYLVDIETGATQNVTSVDRVSFYNGGLFFWPGDANKLGFTALIDGNSHPFRMDRDGHNKTDLTSGSSQFTYGFTSSRDGRRIAYHKNYQIYLADSDGSKATQIVTDNPFNFGPTWSPDGQWVLFVSGEHYNCHPYIVRADGTDLKKLADRNGYRGVMEFLDVPDFHGGSSDTPVWSTDSQSVFYTAKVGENVELLTANLDAEIEQLTKSPEGTLHYHPQPSADGKRLLYGCKQNEIRQLCVMQLSDRAETTITSMTAGHAAIWPHWQP